MVSRHVPHLEPWNGHHHHRLRLTPFPSSPPSSSQPPPIPHLPAHRHHHHHYLHQKPVFNPAGILSSTASAKQPIHRRTIFHIQSRLCWVRNHKVLCRGRQALSIFFPSSVLPTGFHPSLLSLALYILTSRGWGFSCGFLLTKL